MHSLLLCMSFCVLWFPLSCRDFFQSLPERKTFAGTCLPGKGLSTVLHMSFLLQESSITTFTDAHAAKCTQCDGVCFLGVVFDLCAWAKSPILLVIEQFMSANETSSLVICHRWAAVIHLGLSILDVLVQLGHFLWNREVQAQRLALFTAAVAVVACSWLEKELAWALHKARQAKKTCRRLSVQGTHTKETKEFDHTGRHALMHLRPHVEHF